MYTCTCGQQGPCQAHLSVGEAGTSPGQCRASSPVASSVCRHASPDQAASDVGELLIVSTNSHQCTPTQADALHPFHHLCRQLELMGLPYLAS